VSRQILTGSGKIGSENHREPVDYQITQRADFFEEEIGLETTLKRPIINTRDEPHADPGKYRRLHVINADATMSEIQNLVKLGSASLLLMALEDGSIDEPVLLEDPVGSMITVSHDLTMREPLLQRDGASTTALELQRHYFQIAERYVASNDLAPSYKQVIAEWRSLLDDIEAGYERVADRLDWAAKLSVLDGYRRRDGLGWDDPKLGLIGLQFHDIDADRGLFHRLERSGRIRTLFTEAEVESAATTPPESTRAYFRGESIRRYGKAVVAANWDSLVFDTGESTLVRLPMMEPRKGTRDLVEGLFASSPDAATLVAQIGGTNE
jgi:proteasome accessory factor A